MVANAPDEVFGGEQEDRPELDARAEQLESERASKCLPTTPAQEKVVLALYDLIDAAQDLLAEQEDCELSDEQLTFYEDTEMMEHFLDMTEGCLTSVILSTAAISDRWELHLRREKQRQAVQESQEVQKEPVQPNTCTASPSPAPEPAVSRRGYEWL
jgi:hypothetical protein